MYSYSKDWEQGDNLTHSHNILIFLYSLWDILQWLHLAFMFLVALQDFRNESLINYQHWSCSYSHPIAIHLCLWDLLKYYCCEIILNLRDSFGLKK